MSGELDPSYVAARRVLLDTLEHLAPHRGSLTLIGAQAIYLHAGEADVAVSPYTTDSDLALDPRSLAATPQLESSLRSAGLEAGEQPGIWRTPEGIQVDLLVAESLSGTGRRAARLGSHGNRVARKTAGIEGCLIDREERLITSLSPDDRRTCALFVAGPSALLIAKCFKIRERLDSARPISMKDAFDVYRLLLLPTDELNRRLRKLLESEFAAQTTRTGLEALSNLFGDRVGAGSRMAAQAAALIADPDRIRVACETLTRQLVRRLDER